MRAKSIHKKGGGMVYALLIIAILSMLFIGLIQFVVSNVIYSLRTVPREQSLHIAEAGVYFYRWHLAHNVEGKTATQISTFWDNDPLGVDDNGDGDCDDADTVDGDGDGTEAYTTDYEGFGVFSICVTPPSPYSTIVTITTKGWTNNRPALVRTVSARLRKPSWSEFAMLTNAAMRLSSGTEVFGPMHGNDGFRFDGVAHNIFSSGVTTYVDPDTSITRPAVWAGDVSDNLIVDDSANFLAGKEFPVTEQDFDNAAADFSVMKTNATTAGTFWDTSGAGRYIEIGQPTASQMRVTRVESYYTTSYNIYSLSSTDIDVLTIPDEGVIYVEDNVWVHGTVPAGKKITIAAHNDSAGVDPRIFLGIDDIVYENYTSNTVLGLAAEGNIELMRDSEGLTTAPSGSDLETLRIDGALLSQTGSINRDDFGDYKDTILLYGAIASNTRLNFGYTDGTGFDIRTLYFDNDLLFQPPPLFPTGDAYAIDLWAEVE